MLFKSRLNRRPGTVHQTCLSAGVVARHCDCGPLVSPFPIPCSAGHAAWPCHAARRSRAAVARRLVRTPPSLSPSLSTLACRMVPPRRSSPTSAWQFKMAAVATAPLLLPPFPSSSPGRTSPLNTPHSSYPPPVIGGLWPAWDFARTAPSSAFVSERLPELQFFSINRPLLTSLFPSSCRTFPHSSMTTGVILPSLNVAARRSLRRLTVDPPF
jgi:hypothetical protein